MYLDFPWHKFKTVCDVGAGVGAFSMPLARKFPNLDVVVMDLPPVILQAKEVSVSLLYSDTLCRHNSILCMQFWANNVPEIASSGRISFSAGDFFKGLGDGDNVNGCDIYYVRFGFICLEEPELIGAVEEYFAQLA